eukprot:NODE_3341_length_908_cov_211.851472_g3319_i0.p1 GENE.NODE_3341_length_908_cov_211.851472_g3319_i0~~NODE_3341_length_908_cov_211.851472_g3319_i0.p1  ORF type:complete len:288 (-),score=89.61 NODE_3341_length_908_cov_211.851472_g3319_i0:43-822(-)
MAVGKNKKLGKKGGKKRLLDCMLKKEWFDVVAPAAFQERNCCKTLCNKTVGNKLAADNMKGRVFEMSLADLNKDETQGHRNVKLLAQDVQGRSILTSFYGMSLTTDKKCSLVKKWCTRVSAIVDAKTTDGYTLRVSVIGFTKRRKSQVKKNCRCTGAQKKLLRYKMGRIVNRHIVKSDMMALVAKLQHDDVIGDEIYKKANGIYPLRDVFVDKVKIIKSPKFDQAKLMEAHAGSFPTSVEGVAAAGTTAASAAATEEAE